MITVSSYSQEAETRPISEIRKMALTRLPLSSGKIWDFISSQADSKVIALASTLHYLSRKGQPRASGLVTVSQQALAQTTEKVKALHP